MADWNVVVTTHKDGYQRAMHLLEKFTFKDIDKAHKVFIGRAGFDECVILQTCNRVEIFGAAKDPDEHKLL